MPNVREIEVSILGNDDPVASVPGEIVPGNDFYDYAAKYVSDNSDLIIPAPLSDEQRSQIQEMAIRAFTGHRRQRPGPSGLPVEQRKR